MIRQGTYLSFALITLLGLTRSALAESSVVVNNETTTNGSAQVIVNSNTRSSSTTSTSDTSNTHVRIESNGVIREFNTSGGESVDWTSDDGKSSVKINTQLTNTPTPKIQTSSPSPSGAPSAQDRDLSSKKSQSNHGFSLLEFFKSVLSFFGF